MNNDGEEVIEVFEEQKVAEVVAETTDEVVQQEVNEEPVNKKLTIADVKNIIYENIPKNTAETYFRSVKQVHDNFKEDDVRELLKKENEIIEFIETKYDKLTTIKNKLCGMLKVYNLFCFYHRFFINWIFFFLVFLNGQCNHVMVNLTFQLTAFKI